MLNMVTALGCGRWRRPEQSCSGGHIWMQSVSVQVRLTESLERARALSLSLSLLSLSACVRACVPACLPACMPACVPAYEADYALDSKDKVSMKNSKGAAYYASGNIAGEVLRHLCPD